MLFENRLRFFGIIAVSSFLALGATCTEEDGEKDDDAGLFDVEPQDSVEDEIDCLDISDDEECSAQDHCTVYGALKVDTEVALGSELDCADDLDRWSSTAFCVREEWTISDHQMNSAYARYDEEEDEWTVYFTYDTPEGHEEMGFYSCAQIPEVEHAEVRELCYECR